jgi:hypothetical protein
VVVWAKVGMAQCEGGREWVARPGIVVLHHCSRQRWRCWWWGLVVSRAHVIDCWAHIVSCGVLVSRVVVRNGPEKDTLIGHNTLTLSFSGSKKKEVK